MIGWQNLLLKKGLMSFLADWPKLSEGELLATGLKLKAKIPIKRPARDLKEFVQNEHYGN